MKTIAFSIALLAALALPGAARAQVHVVGDLSRHVELAPGAESQGEVLVRNGGDRPRTARVYLTGYHATADGRTVYGEPGESPRSSAAWIHLVPREQEIAPGSTASFHYVIRVPQDPRLAGSYWSMLMVEPVAPETLAPGATRGGVGIRTVTRTGIHLATHIAGTGHAELKFADRRLEQGEKGAALLLDLENAGDRYLRLHLWADLFDREGIPAGRFEGGRKGLYPADSGRVRIDLDGIAPGTYRAIVVADGGDERVFGARYELEIR